MLPPPKSTFASIFSGQKIFYFHSALYFPRSCTPIFIPFQLSISRINPATLSASSCSSFFFSFPFSFSLKSSFPPIHLPARIRFQQNPNPFNSSNLKVSSLPTLHFSQLFSPHSHLSSAFSILFHKFSNWF